MATQVVKLKRSKGVVVQDCDVYIGRRLNMGGWRLKDSIFANPFKIGSNYPTALDATIAFWDYIHSPEQKDLLDKVSELKGKTLGCWCKKKQDDACHGDVLAFLADGITSSSMDIILNQKRGNKDITNTNNNIINMNSKKKRDFDEPQSDKTTDQTAIKRGKTKNEYNKS
mmetsp:Transcript_25358/g.30054  ORF Transcript_25358/g.30054 Transcript_25358/m.30054 type:complete len:170 (+) Transcript_25358:55-564(+)